MTNIKSNESSETWDHTSFWKHSDEISSSGWVKSWERAFVPLTLFICHLVSQMTFLLPNRKSMWLFVVYMTRKIQPYHRYFTFSLLFPIAVLLASRWKFHFCFWQRWAWICCFICYLKERKHRWWMNCWMMKSQYWEKKLKREVVGNHVASRGDAEDVVKEDDAFCRKGWVNSRLPMRAKMVVFCSEFTKVITKKWKKKRSSVRQ